MPLFRCTKCGCIENTALSRYWIRNAFERKQENNPPLCSECDPEIGRWHNRFEKKPASGMLLANDGFLYSKAELETDNWKWRAENQGLTVVEEIK